MTDNQWPVAEFDQLRRLRIIASTSPGVAIHETVIDAPLEAVWAVATDLEGEVPKWMFADIRSIKVSPTAASDRLVARAYGYSGVRARFDVVLRPNWCLMQSRFLLGGMAAEEEAGATRFAFMGGFRGPLRHFARVARPLSARIGEHATARLAARVSELSRRREPPIRDQVE